ncbi:hypothetical protein [Acidilobus sp. 7A]|uniref:hypothetical protein n=1 Tax=Acidilobus sp. 7A TaxID=1577685 RepID=UPI001B3B52B3|nr:hypothetical protein [Acidilobus sp. 7A]
MASASGQAPSPEVERSLGSIRTMVLVALIFAILALIGEIVALGLVGFAGAVISKQGIVSPVASAELGLIGFLSVIFLIIDVVVVRCAWKMYSAVQNGDIAALKSLNSLGWAIVALIFSGVIPGVLLLIAHGRIEDLPSPQV